MPKSFHKQNLPFQSTPSVGRATRNISAPDTARGISIHALRGEGDVTSILKIAGIEDISIHALRGEGDLQSYENNKIVKIFQSTPSVGRATIRTKT